MPPKHPDVPGDEPAISPALSRRRDHMLHGYSTQQREPRLVSPDDGEPGSPPDLDSFPDEEFDPEIPPPPIAAAHGPAPAVAERGDTSARRPMVWPIVVAAFSVVGLGAMTWIAYDAVMVETSGGAIPYIAAEAGPEKIRPQQEGGLEVPNQNIRVYNELNGSPALPEAEVLLPAPEIPVSPPVAAEPTPPTVVGETLGASATQPDADAAAGSQTQPTETAVAEASNSELESSSAAAPSAKQAGGSDSTQTVAAAEAFRIQLVAVKNRDAARAAWKKMTKAHPEVLKGLAPKIVKVDRAAGGVLYRVQGGPFADRAAAESACGKLKQRSQDCLVVAPQP